jgi:hypothetical protein
MGRYCKGGKRKVKIEKFMIHISKIYKVFFLLMLVLTLFSCQEGREAGDLLGQWRMVNSNSKYISFSGSLTEFRYIENNTLKRTIFGNFQHVGDSLFIQFYSIKEAEKDADTKIIEETYEMKPFNNIRVKIEMLDNEHLSLSKNGKVWNYYKY